MGKVVGVALFLTVGLVLFRLLEGRRETPRRWRTDLSWFFFLPLVGKPIQQVGVALLIAPALLALGRTLDEGLTAGYGPLAQLPWGVQVGVVLGLVDLAGYWMHRLHHHGFLWRLHAVHHSAEDLDWLSAVRVHPLNAIGQRAPGALLVLALGFDLTAVAAAAPIFGLYGVLLHSRVDWRFGPLAWLVVTPAYHRWHHSTAVEGGCNFAGLFPLWDLVFGTFHLPDGTAGDFGTGDHRVPETFTGQLLHPFRRS
jgi:sterol desaturase/sphingolipid hydroxylase (fatty acid hydroxylase superfamily)